MGNRTRGYLQGIFLVFQSAFMVGAKDRRVSWMLQTYSPIGRISRGVNRNAMKARSQLLKWRTFNRTVVGRDHQVLKGFSYESYFCIPELFGRAFAGLRLQNLTAERIYTQISKPESGDSAKKDSTQKRSS